MKLKIKRLSSSAVIPQYAHPGDAGLDLVSIESKNIAPGESQLIRTGIAIELPPGTEAQVRPRSGLALKHQITVLNTPGTIDEGYRGEICVILINHGTQAFQVEPGMRIAQMVIASFISVTVEAVDALEDSARASGGFGSTGVQGKAQSQF
ncbi:dUTP diphosphatase [Altericista sp. CCNU0014]|uniref:dUTP diphosphatase n=1 Tax=Altericista sp. CCNU0014 TaxID=3082949 RepID=UPI00385153B5